MAQYKTPGVYVQEIDAFPNSVVPVPTAVPLFIGYTEKAEIAGKSILNQPQELSNFAEFTQIFGVPPRPLFALTPGSQDQHVASYVGTDQKPRFLDIERSGPIQPILPTAMRLFFQNGGGDCFVLSVGDFADADKAISADALIAALDTVKDFAGPTLLLAPDAVLLPKAEDFARLVQAMLAQCGELQDRFAILDVHGADRLAPDSGTLDSDIRTLISSYRDLLGRDHLNYGASYFPFLNTTCVAPDETDYRWFDQAPLIDALTTQAKTVFKDDALTQVTGLIARIADAKASPSEIAGRNSALRGALPVLDQLETAAAKKACLLPPSAAMAGLFTRVDNEIGVWKAPANFGLSAVLSPSVSIDNALQEDLNISVLDGKSINAIRSFTGRGILVWGARTLDGNSQDWRYVSVRRTLIFVEQSCKQAIQAFVFEPNDANTWATVKAMLSNFLTTLWQEGALQGATASAAFGVECGLGTTMTAQDVLDGHLNVTIRLAVMHPAEFIVLSFSQQMQEP